MEVSNDKCIAQHLRFVSAGDEKEKNSLFLGSIHLMKPGLSLKLLYPEENTFTFALDFH